MEGKVHFFLLVICAPVISQSISWYVFQALAIASFAYSAASWFTFFSFVFVGSGSCLWCRGFSVVQSWTSQGSMSTECKKRWGSYGCRWTWCAGSFVTLKNKHNDSVFLPRVISPHGCLLFLYFEVLCSIVLWYMNWTGLVVLVCQGSGLPYLIHFYLSAKSHSPCPPPSSCNVFSFLIVAGYKVFGPWSYETRAFTCWECSRPSCRRAGSLD